MIAVSKTPAKKQHVTLTIHSFFDDICHFYRMFCFFLSCPRVLLSAVSFLFNFYRFFFNRYNFLRFLRSIRFHLIKFASQGLQLTLHLFECLFQSLRSYVLSEDRGSCYYYYSDE